MSKPFLLSTEKREDDNKLDLRMLPTLINSLQTVAVGIQYVGSVVTGGVVKARPGCTIISGACCDSHFIESFDFFNAFRNEANMDCAGIRIALSQPEKDATVLSESFQVWKSGWSIYSVIVNDMVNAKGARPFRKNRLIASGWRPR